MSDNKYTASSSVPSDRTEKLLRDTESSQGSKASSSEASDTKSASEISELKLPSMKRLGPGISLAEKYPEGASSSKKLKEGMAPRPRLLVVANRLPFSAVGISNNSWSLEISSGGPVTSLLGLKEFEAVYFGWAGMHVTDEAGQKELTEALIEKRCIPVFIDEEIFHQYYNGYCNNTLRPLFHYLGIPQGDGPAKTKSYQSQFDAYKEANRIFSNAVIKHYKEGDVVWCHDYHLMFLPKYLKEHNSQIKVGWFLHTPFPSSEAHRSLPSRSELLNALLSADLVGFHTFDYARHFVGTCIRILGVEGSPEGIEYQGRFIRVAVFPIGIYSDRFFEALETPEVRECIKEFTDKFSGRKVILGVDRLDMVKGIPEKILAFEKFLEDNKDQRKEVILLQIAKLASRVHMLVGRINGKFGTLTNVPLIHLDQPLKFHTLCALYALADVALVTPLRDGMNLVSYEYVACQKSKNGVLVLSEFAGAAQSLGAGAILVNPWNIEELASSIGRALNMEDDERKKRHQNNFQHVITHTSQEWAEAFVRELDDAVIGAQQRIKGVPTALPVTDAIEHYLQSNNRLLVLGFNAVLTEPVDSLNRRGEDPIGRLELRLNPDLKNTLMELCSDPKTTIVVLSGSNKLVLDGNFCQYKMWLAAENGIFLRSATGEWMTSIPEHLNMDWIDCIKPVFEYFAKRTPRSYFEFRNTSLVWNYKYADAKFGRVQAIDLLQHLCTGLSNAFVDVIQGSSSVEVRALGVTKGTGIHRILGELAGNSDPTQIDYVLCIGHFLGKDEDLYTYFEQEHPVETPRTTGNRMSEPRLQNSGSVSGKKTACNVLDLKKENYFPCTVDRTRSSARYFLESSSDVVSLLKALAAASSLS
ncbi:hypothetical protein ACET3Z_023081 [Daucus carota]